MIRFVTYCTEDYRPTADLLIKSVRRHTNADTKLYTRKDLEQDPFYEKNKAILDIPRGAGCWLWKIYYIHKTLIESKENDLIFYADAASELIANPQPLLDLLKQQDVFLISGLNRPPNKHWTKRDAFHYMNCDTPEYRDGENLLAAFVFLRNTEHARAFVAEWLQYGCDMRIMDHTKSYSGLPECEGFREHRWDQSILSLLAIRHRIEIHRDPTQYGEKYADLPWRKGTLKVYDPKPFKNSPYPQLFFHHRQKRAPFRWRHLKYYLSKK